MNQISAARGSSKKKLCFIKITLANILYNQIVQICSYQSSSSSQATDRNNFYFTFLVFFSGKIHFPRRGFRATIYWTLRIIIQNPLCEKKNSDFWHEKRYNTFSLIIHGRRKSVPTHHYLPSNGGPVAGRRYFRRGSHARGRVAWKSSIVGNNVRCS